MDLEGKVNCDHVVGNPPISYTLVSCPRCMKKGWYGGYYYGFDGKINTIVGVKQLTQQILKILTENKRNTGYGFDQSLLRGVIDSSTLPSIKNEIVRCMNYLKGVQDDNEKSGYFYNPDEKISSINNIQVAQDSLEPRKVTITFSVVAVSGKGFDINTAIGQGATGGVQGGQALTSSSTSPTLRTGNKILIPEEPPSPVI